MRIRSARREDSTVLSRLSDELGYPTSAKDMTWRLDQILPNPLHHVCVAEMGGQVVGWIAAEQRLTLESGVRFEIVGLVVNARFRRMGIATALLSGAENWVREAGGTHITVRSNISRDEPHALYLHRGYSRKKTQHVYWKPV